MKMYFLSSQLVGGPFDLKENFLVKEPNVVLLILELLPDLPEELQVSVVAGPLPTSNWERWSTPNLGPGPGGKGGGCGRG